MCSARRVARATAVLVLLLCSSVGHLDAQASPRSDAGPDVSGMVAVPVILDGSRSYDPRGQLITFRWTLAQSPTGSVATLDASDPAPVFVPDLPGTYRFQLVVTNEDGERSRSASMTLDAFARSAAPNARAGNDRHVAIGAPVDLDAGMSSDPLLTPLTFRWSLVSAPRGQQDQRCGHRGARQRNAVVHAGCSGRVCASPGGQQWGARFRRSHHGDGDHRQSPSDRRCRQSSDRRPRRSDRIESAQRASIPTAVLRGSVSPGVWSRGRRAARSKAARSATRMPQPPA